VVWVSRSELRNRANAEGRDEMTNNKPWLDGPSAKDRAIAKMWQGGPTCLIGLGVSAFTHFWFGFVIIWTVLLFIAGLFWFATGLVTYWTGVE